MADLTDRHQALFANNQHPLQLDIYSEYNKFLRVMHSEGHHARQNELGDRVAEIAEHRQAQLNHTEGETLDWDDYQDIYCQAKGEQRVKHNFEINTRNKKGDIADYLEARRPFGAT